ncbi:hypothetical protein Tco_0032343 [Tanacetum coccineum]
MEPEKSVDEAFVGLLQESDKGSLCLPLGLLCYGVRHYFIELQSGIRAQALGVVRLSLAKNLAFNVVNEKTTLGLLKALSNMYEKPSASNKVFLIRQLVNTKMTEGAAVAAVSSTSCTNKLMFKDIRDMILGEDIRRRKFGEYLNSLLSATGHGRKSNRGRSGSRKKSPSENTRNFTCWNYKENGHIRKEYCESLVMDLSASFHATPCMRMLKNFNRLLGKFRLADIKVLDVAGIGDGVLKITFGTEWILKNVTYISSLKRRLISAERLNAISEWLVEKLHDEFCVQTFVYLLSNGKVLRLTDYSEQEFSHEALICEWQIGVSVQWEQAMVRMSSLWENQTWFFGQVTSGKAKNSVVSELEERQRVGSVRGSAVAEPSRAVTIMGLGPYGS